jgi:hypothetical protein
MTITKRADKKWNINEVIRLQREYELLELSIQEIAKLHERSEKAILCRLEKEGFIENWCQAKGFNEYAILQPELYDYIIHLQNVYNNTNNSDDEANDDPIDVVKNEINIQKIQNKISDVFSFFKFFT